jgi:hypothetical protein
MAVGTFVPTLHTLSDLLDKGAAHASAQKRDAATLVNARLAPDMFPLGKQVQAACDHAKSAAAILAGQTPQRFEDNEKTFAELKDRIARTVAYVETFSASAFDAAADREIKYPLQAGLVMEMNGLQFLRDWALPNFYFHVVTAYDILRHNGVDIGKRDYMSHVAYAIRQPA